MELATTGREPALLERAAEIGVLDAALAKASAGVFKGTNPLVSPFNAG